MSCRKIFPFDQRHSILARETERLHPAIRPAFFLALNHYSIDAEINKATSQALGGGHALVAARHIYGRWCSSRTQLKTHQSRYGRGGAPTASLRRWCAVVMKPAGVQATACADFRLEIVKGLIAMRDDAAFAPTTFWGIGKYKVILRSLPFYYVRIDL